MRVIALNICYHIDPINDDIARCYDAIPRLWNANITASQESLLVHILPLEISNCYSENYRAGPEEALIWPQHQGLSMQLSSVPFVVAATLRLATTVGDSLEILVPMKTAKRGSVCRPKPWSFRKKYRKDSGRTPNRI